MLVYVLQVPQYYHLRPHHRGLPLPIRTAKSSSVAYDKLPPALHLLATAPPARRPDAPRPDNATSPKSPPAQRTLSTIVHQSRFRDCRAAAVQLDLLHPHPTCRNRAQVKLLESAQPEAGEWLNVAPDGTKGTEIDSDTLLVMLQRRANLDLSVAKGANDALAAAGEIVDRKGDDLQNAGDYTSRHNDTMYAARDMLLSAAAGRIVVGDKEKPWKTAQFNASHVPDLVEMGGDHETGRDILWEIKVPSATKAEYKAGRGQQDKGGNFATNGHLYGFGNLLQA